HRLFPQVHQGPAGQVRAHQVRDVLAAEDERPVRQGGTVVRVHPCYFYTPALRVDLVQRSAGPRPGTAQVLDLEDSIPARSKVAAREALAACDLSGTGLPGVVLRLNSIETPDGLADLRMLL